MNVPQELSKDETTNDASSTTVAIPGGFGLIEPVVEPVEIQAADVQQGDQPDRFITADELKENRLSQNGIVYGKTFEGENFHVFYSTANVFH